MYTDMPRTKRLAERAYSYIVHDVMPEEAMISFPVPLLRDSRLIAAFFCAVTRATSDRTNRAIYQPGARVFVDWDQERVVGHEVAGVDVRIEESEPAGLLLTPEFAGAESDEANQRILVAMWELYSLLDQVGPLYPRSDLMPGELDAVKRCERAFRRMLPERLSDLYTQLNADFFDWMEQGARGPSRCAGCGAANPPSSRFCNRCGASLGCRSCAPALCPAAASATTAAPRLRDTPLSPI